MHPEIRQEGPGSCLICGMALAPLEVSTESVLNHELAEMTRRFRVGLALTFPVFVLEMGGHIPGLGLHDLVAPATSTWIRFVLATPVVLWAGWPFFQRGWASLVSRHLNMFTLIALGTGAVAMVAEAQRSRGELVGEALAGLDGRLDDWRRRSGRVGCPR